MTIQIHAKCWLQQKECGERGHGETIWARRIASNGATFIRSACADCGKTDNHTEKAKDHPRRSSYPEIVPHDGECYCMLCEQQRADARAFREHLEAQCEIIAVTADGRAAHIGNVEWAAYLASEEWHARRAACHERYGHRCAICNRSEELQAHHRTYVRVTREDPTDLISLCRGCHELFHFGRRPV